MSQVGIELADANFFSHQKRSKKTSVEAYSIKISKNYRHTPLKNLCGLRLYG